jgi:hypothetical protein
VSKRMKAGTGLKSGGRAEPLKQAEAHDNPILAFRAGEKGLNAESGDQRVERQDRFGTSHISVSGCRRCILDWRSENIDRYQRPECFWNHAKSPTRKQNANFGMEESVSASA